LLKDKLLSLLQVGYVAVDDTPYKGNLASALRKLNETVVVMGKYLVGNANFQSTLNTTALTALALTATANTTSTIQNIMDASTFINAGSSTGYTRNAGSLIATVPATGATVIATAVSITTANYVVLKTVETLGTGSIAYYVSRDNGTTYTRIYSGAGVFLGEQPAGTNVVYKVVITGNAALNKIGFNFR
jgi:hypothetical protein